jgi:hypothetical protein
MDDATANPSSLPAIAFAVWPATGETVAILRGHRETYRIGSSKPAEELNQLYGVTRAQQRAMLAGVMRGWKNPFPDAENSAPDGEQVPSPVLRHD